MNFDENKKFYTDLIPATGLTSYLVGKEANPSGELADAQVLIGAEKVISMDQVHGNNIEIVGQKNIDENNLVLPKTDGIIAQARGVFLSVKVADCMPIIIYHPSGVLGLVHAGRKGAQKQILKKALEIFRDDFSISQDLTLWFGPAICEESYQIDEESDEHYDLINENYAQVKSVYTFEQRNVIECNYCPVHENDKFFSYRAENTTKRNFVFVRLD